MSLKNIFKLSKENIITDIVLAFFWMILFLSIPSWGFQKAFLSSSLSHKVIIVLLGLLSAIVVYYPLTCSLVFVCKRIAKTKEKEKPAKSDWAVAALIILIWNPFIGPGFIMKGIADFNHNVINQPCGIEVTGFPENSPARDAGMSVGEVIISVDGNATGNADSFMHVMANKKDGDFINIKTRDNEYNIKVVSGPDGRGSFVGINVQEVYCKR